MKTKLLITTCIAALGIGLMLGLTGCADDKFGADDPRPLTDGLTLSMSCVDMLPQFVDPSPVGSRASDPKNEEEKKINTLHLFFFDYDSGEFLVPNAEINFPPYQRITSNVIKIPQDAFTSMNNVRVVAVANINGTDDTNGNHFKTQWTPGGLIENGTRDSGTPYEINNYSDLQKWVYAPKLRTQEQRSISELPSAGMPMIGESPAINLNEAYQGQNRREILMKALMARVNISVKLTPKQESLDGSLPQMRITGYGIKNMPTTVPFAKPTGVKNGNNEDITQAEVEEEIEMLLESPVTINKDSEAVTFSYYTYENVQLPDYSAQRPGAGGDFFPGSTTTPVYPDGIKDDDKQRWKPLMAREKASALILRGNYITHQGLNYNAQFTIYMGANPNDDFKVERNHEYNNNITVRGLDYVRNSEDNVYTFDARVNVLTDNPLYLAIVNERQVDAHATALPMDVWLLLREPANGSTEMPEVTHNSTVTIEIPEDARSWMSMVMIPRAEMEAGGFKAGTGAEPYFYTDMLELCNNGKILTASEPEFVNKKPHFNGAQSGPVVTINSTPTLNNSRSRVYFYIDENITPNASGDVPDRVTRIKLTYTNDKDGGDTRVRYLEIEQRGLVHVNGRWQSTDGWSSENIDTYMEYYEEYLEHSDPLDQHEMPGELYEGLPWGLRGESVRNIINSGQGSDGCVIYRTNQAFPYTKRIIEYSTNTLNPSLPISNLWLFNNEAPKSAFHYCYGKNKRNHDGTVSSTDTGWYMPGIRELERALVQYYLQFEDFRDNFYWSAACGSENVLIIGHREMVNNARSTKVTLRSDGTPDYTESEGTAAGSKDRNTPLRIRAFYKPK